MSKAAILVLSRTTVPVPGGGGRSAPDLGNDDDNQRLGSSNDDRFWFRQNLSNFIALVLLGTLGGQEVYFLVATDDQIVDLLVTRAGSRGYSIQEALAHPPLRQVLRDETNLQYFQRVSDGETVGIVPPAVIRGQSALAIGIGALFDPDEDYVIIEEP